MGCDMHCAIESSHTLYGSERLPDEGTADTYWSNVVQWGHVDRDYEMFGLLAGVRTGPPVYAPRGIAPNMSWETKRRCYETTPDGEVTDKWIEDWHSPGWLTTDEFREVLMRYVMTYEEQPAVSYRTMLHVMEAYEKDGEKCRVVFWFDN